MYEQKKNRIQIEFNSHLHPFDDKMQKKCAIIKWNLDVGKKKK